jgi:hypothetical protein
MFFGTARAVKPVDQKENIDALSHSYIAGSPTRAASISISCGHPRAAALTLQSQ